jgi:hypothetical protein
MRISGRIGRSAAAGALATVIALIAAAATAATGWPGVESAQPLVQAPRVCAPNIVPINHRCRVVVFQPLGELDGRPWYYAFYATHWADRHGRRDRGFPIFFYLEAPATIRLGLWINDAPGLNGRWAMTPPQPPVVIRRGDDTYLGLTLKNVGATPDQRLFRLDGERWRKINILRRSDDDEDLIAKAEPRGCSRAGDGLFDWTDFTVTWPLKTDLTSSPCGVMTADLAVRGDGLILTDARVER